MGTSISTGFVKCSEIDTVVSALDLLLQADGYRPLDPENSLEEPESALHVAFAVSASDAGWSVIKTIPAVLLARQRRRGLRPWLSLLCELLRADGLFVGLYDSSHLLVLEARGNGTACFQGTCPEDAEAFEDAWLSLQGSAGANVPVTEPVPRSAQELTEFLLQRRPKREFILHASLNELIGPWPIGGEATFEAIARELTGAGEELWGSTVESSQVLKAPASQWVSRRYEREDQ